MADRPIIFSGPMVRALLDGRKTQTRRLVPVPRFEAQGCRPADVGGPWWDFWSMDRLETQRFKMRYAPGDRLWVREAWSIAFASDLAPGEAIERDAAECAAANRGFACACGDGVVYRATGAQQHPDHGKARWRTPIHMPRWASRITLNVTDVRVQRLQDISEADAVAEGMIWSDPTEQDRQWARDYAEENGGDADIRGVWLAPGTRQGYGSTKEERERMQWGQTAAFAYRRVWISLHGTESWDANHWVAALTFTVNHRNIDAAKEAEE